MSSILFFSTGARAQSQLVRVAGDGDALPQGGSLTGIAGWAMLNSAGHVMLTAGVAGDQGQTSTLFVWTPGGGVAQVVAQGETVSGTVNPHTVPDLTYGPGWIARDGSVLVGYASDVAFVRSAGGPFNVIAETAPCPHDPDNWLSNWNAPLYTDNGHVGFRSNDLCHNGYWLGTASGVQPIVSLPANIDGWPLSTEPASLYDAIMFGELVSETGEVWFSGTVSCDGDPLCPAGHAVGLFAASASDLRTVLRANEPAPGLADGSLLVGFPITGVSGAGHLVTVGVLSQQPDASDGQRAIYVVDPSGVASLVARVGDPAPGLSGVTFASFLTRDPGGYYHEAWVADDGSVIFGARITGTGVTSNDDITYWRRSAGGTLSLVLRNRAPAAGLPGALYDGFVVEVSPAGRIAFTSHLLGQGYFKTYLFMEDAELQLQPVLGDGAQVDVGGTSYVLQSPRLLARPTNYRGITTGSDGRGMRFNGRGELLFMADAPAPTVFVAKVGPPPPQVDILGVEVVQTVQNWRNTVPLVERKPTFVRVHAEAATPTQVRTRLRARRDGVELAGSPFAGTSLGAITVAEPDAGARRHLLGANMYFELPPEWAQGTLELEVEVHPSSGDVELRCKEQAGPTADDCKVTVTFEEMPKLELRLLQLGYQVSGAFIQEPRGSARGLVRDILSLLPVNAVDLSEGSYQNLVTLGASHIAALTADDFLQDVIEVRTLDGCGAACQRLYYGYYPSALKRVGGLADGIPGAAAVGNIVPRGWGRYRHVHELSHVLGEQHATDENKFGARSDGALRGACGEVSEPGTSAWPHFENLNGSDVAVLSPLDDPQTIEYGLDASTWKVIDPREQYEIMSYCAGSTRPAVARWISGRTYTRLKSAIAARFPSAAPPNQRESYNFVALYDTPTEQRGVSVRRLMRAELDDPPPPPPPGDYTVELLDGQSVSYAADVALRAFVQEPELGDAPRDDTAGYALIAVPASLPFDAVVVRAAGAELARLEASPAPPVVTVTSPNGGETLDADTVELSWTGSDADGEPLTYDVSFSRDDGVTWTRLAGGIATTSITLPRGALASSSQALFRVDASDGFHVGSDVSDAPFSVVGEGPLAVILRPQGGTLYLADEPVILSGFAADGEGGELDEAAFEWSKASAVLGTGRALTVGASTLGDGEHTVTLRVTDPRGGVGADTVAVRVVSSRPASLHDVSVSGSARTAVRPGDPLTLEVTATNNGPDDAAAVTLRVDLAPELALGAPTPSQGSCAQEIGAYVCALGALARAASATLSFTGTPTLEGLFYVRGSADAGAGDPFLANNEEELAVLVSELASAPAPDPDDPGADTSAPGTKDGGCGCTGTGADGVLYLGLIAIVLLSARRRVQV